MIQTLSIKDARNNLADIVSRVEMRGDEIVITKFGKPRAMLVPISDKKTLVDKFDETFGAWRGRKDIKDSGEWVRNLRRKISLRQKL
jgi:prevent-host-death family protein